MLLHMQANEIFTIMPLNCLIQVQQNGGRTWPLYGRQSQGYGRKLPIFRRFSNYRTTLEN